MLIFSTCIIYPVNCREIQAVRSSGNRGQGAFPACNIMFSYTEFCFSFSTLPSHPQFSHFLFLHNGILLQHYALRVLQQIIAWNKFQLNGKYLFPWELLTMWLWLYFLLCLGLKPLNDLYFLHFPTVLLKISIPHYWSEHSVFKCGSFWFLCGDLMPDY